MFNKKLVDRILTEHSKERENWEAERKELLNRIAKPEVFIPTTNGNVETVEPSKDEEELAFVGGEVPPSFRAPEDG